MRVVLIALLAGLALTGCGAESPASDAAAAEVVPANVSAFVSLDADLASEQWDKAGSLLDRFPGKQRFLRALNDALAEEQLDWKRDVEPAIGDELAFFSFAPGRDGGQFVGLTKPADEAKFRALAAKLDDGPSTIEQIDGWTVFSNDAALVDRVRAGGGGSLADNDAFQAAVGALPEDRLGLLWARGGALGGLVPFGPATSTATPAFDWVAGALEARDDGAALTVVTSGSAAPADAYVSKYVAEAPGDALVFASFSADSLNEQATQLEPLGSVFGLRIGDLLRELRGEGALWIRPGEDFIELTAVVDANDPTRATAALDRIRKVLPDQLQSGVVAKKLVVTTAGSVARVLERSGSPLGETPDFEAAIEAAGMPDRTSGFLYVDVAHVVPFLLLAGAGGFEVPSDLVQNLRPIRSLVGWAEPDGARTRFELFAQIQ